MGVEYFKCANPVCDEVISDHDDYLTFKITKSNGPNIEGSVCDSCNNIGNEYIFQLDNDNFLIKCFWKNPTIQELNDKIWDVPDVLKIIIINYLPQFDFQLLIGLNQKTYQKLQQYINRCIKITGIPFEDDDIRDAEDKIIFEKIKHQHLSTPSEEITEVKSTEHQTREYHENFSLLWDRLYNEPSNKNCSLMKLCEPDEFLCNILTLAEDRKFVNEYSPNYYFEPLNLFETPTQLERKIQHYEHKITEIKQQIIETQSNEDYLFSKWYKEEAAQPFRTTKKRKRECEHENRHRDVYETDEDQDQDEDENNSENENDIEEVEAEMK